MKKSFIKIAAACSCVSLLAAPFCANAKTNVLAMGSVTTQTFGVPYVAITAGNPFYDLTKTFGEVKDYFSSGDPVNRLTIETDNLNQVGAELIAAYQINPKGNKMMVKALTNYQREIYNYALALSHVSPTDIADQDSSISEVISLTIAHHLRFIDDMGGWQFKTNAQVALLRDISDKMNTTSVATLSSLVGDAAFINSLTERVGDQSITEQIRTAETLNILAKAVANSGNNVVAKELLDARTTILLALTNANVAEVVSVLASTAGSPTERLQTVLFLVSQPAFATSSALIDLKNQLLIKAF